MEGPARPAWSFRAGLEPPRREENERFERALLTALRSAVAWGAEFDLTLESGPSPLVTVRPGSDLGRRWLARVFTGAYRPGQWTRLNASPTPSPGPGLQWFGRLQGGPLPGRTAPAAPWIDPVLRSLELFPRGLRLRWWFRPGARPTPHPVAPPFVEPARLPPGFRLRAPTEIDRAERDGEALAERGPFWAVAAVAESARADLGERALERWCEAVSAASAIGGRGRIVFRRRSRLLGRRPPWFVLSESEIVAVLPSSSSPGPRLPSSCREPTRMLALGHDETGDAIGLPMPAEEGRHVLVLGETGMGKSTALLRLALAAAADHNVVVFDPIGDTGRRLLALLPARRLAQALWISPRDSPVPIDLLRTLRECGDDVGRADRAIGDLVLALRRVRSSRYADATFWGPRIEETVRLVLRAAAALPGTGLADLPRLLGEPYRIPAGAPEEARAALAALADRIRDRPEELDGSRRLLAELSDRSALRSLLGASAATLRIADLSRPGRVTVLSGDALTVGEDAARYLLAVYLTLFWSDRLARPTTTKTILVLDEVQWYAHETLAELLRLGRRTNLHVWLATQSLANLDEGLRDAVATNVADLVVFRGAPSDARELARLVPSLTPELLWSLPAGRAILLRGKGEVIRFVAIDPPSFRGGGSETDRLEIARAASAPYLPEAAPREAREEQARAADPAPPVSGSDGRDPARPAMLAIWSELLDSGEAGQAEIRLEALREIFDPSGSVVRELGRRLKEAGVLLRTGRDATGTWWQVGRAGFDRLLGPGVDPVELAAAAHRWASRPAAAGAPAPE